MCKFRCRVLGKISPPQVILLLLILFLWLKVCRIEEIQSIEDE